jgi:hypothetical protein
VKQVTKELSGDSGQKTLASLQIVDPGDPSKGIEPIFAFGGGKVEIGDGLPSAMQPGGMGLADQPGTEWNGATNDITPDHALIKNTMINEADQLDPELYKSKDLFPVGHWQRSSMGYPIAHWNKIISRQKGATVFFQGILVQGGDFETRVSFARDLQTISRTPRGREMFRYFNRTKRQERLIVDGGAYARDEGWFTHGVVAVSSAPFSQGYMQQRDKNGQAYWSRVPRIIILAHELGHLYSRVYDEDHKDDMINVNLNENPIRKSLGYDPRISYGTRVRILTTGAQTYLGKGDPYVENIVFIRGKHGAADKWVWVRQPGKPVIHGN